MIVGGAGGFENDASPVAVDTEAARLGDATFVAGQNRGEVGDDLGLFRASGVRMFLGWTEEAGETVLREVASLGGPGLRFEGATEDRTMGFHPFRERPEDRQGIRLATLNGRLVGLEDHAIGGVGHDHDLDDKGRTGG